MRILNDKSRKYFLIYSILFSIACAVTLYDVPLWIKFIVFVFVSILIYAILVCIKLFIQKKQNSKKIPKTINLKIWSYAIIFLLIFIPYVVIASINYPGLGTNDSDIIVNSALGKTFDLGWYRYHALSTQHSLFYIFIFYVFNNILLPLNDLSLTIYIFILFQSIICAIFFTWSIYWAQKHIKNRIYLILLIICIICNPVLITFAPQLLKDVPFFIVFIWMCFKLYDISLKKNVTGKDHFLLFAIMFFLCLFRNNGIMVVLITLLFMFILNVGKRKLIILYFIFLVLITCFYEFIFLDLMNIEKTHFIELISVPFQQIAYTYLHNGNFTDEQLNFINNIVPVTSFEQYYDPTNIHNLKFRAPFNDSFLDNNKFEFILNWFQIFLNNPLEFIQAWVYQTSSCWSPFTPSWIGEEAKIILGPATTNYYVPGLSTFLFLNFVVFRYTIFNSGLFIWIILGFMMFKFLYSSNSYNKKWIVCFIPAIVLFLIYTLSNPSTNWTFRYMLPAFIFIMYLPCFWNKKIQN